MALFEFCIQSAYATDNFHRGSPQVLHENIKEMGLNELLTFVWAPANKQPVSGEWLLLAVMFVGAAQHESVVNRSLWGMRRHTAAGPAEPYALHILLKKEKKKKESTFCLCGGQQ